MAGKRKPAGYGHAVADFKDRAKRLLVRPMWRFSCLGRGHVMEAPFNKLARGSRCDCGEVMIPQPTSTGEELADGT